MLCTAGKLGDPEFSSRLPACGREPHASLPAAAAKAFMGLSQMGGVEDLMKGLVLPVARGPGAAATMVAKGFGPPNAKGLGLEEPWVAEGCDCLEASGCTWLHGAESVRLVTKTRKWRTPSLRLYSTKLGMPTRGAYCKEAARLGRRTSPVAVVCLWNGFW